MTIVAITRGVCRTNSSSHAQHTAHTPSPASHLIWWTVFSVWLCRHHGKAAAVRAFHRDSRHTCHSDYSTWTHTTITTVLIMTFHYLTLFHFTSIDFTSPLQKSHRPIKIVSNSRSNRQRSHIVFPFICWHYGKCCATQRFGQFYNVGGQCGQRTTIFRWDR